MINVLKYVFNKPTRIKSITQDGIVFDNGYCIDTFHEQDCCELVYADFVGSLQDTGAEKALFKEVTIEAIDRYGAKLNGLYGISCYDIQNGYYNGNIRFDLKDEQGNIVASTDFIETKFIHDFELGYRKERFVNPTNLLDT